MNKLRSILQTPLERVYVSRLMNETFRPQWWEVHRRQKAGKRVPNKLWWRHGKPITSHTFLLALMCLMYIAIGVSTLVRFDTVIPPSHTLGRIFFRDFAWFSMWTLLLMMAGRLCQVLFDPRWLRLWRIKWIRNKLSRQMRHKGKAYFSGDLGRLRLAMLLGIVVYLPLLMAAADVGNMPPVLIAFSTAIGHARIAPLAFFPLANTLNPVLAPFRSRMTR